MDELKPELAARQQQGLYRRRLISQSPQGVRPVIEGRQVLSFCSNDYLGLANHPRVKQAFKDAAEQYGVGSGSAHLVNGHSQLHHDCELRLAEFTGRDRALLFSTGYMANLAVTSALVGRRDFIYQDKLNHASLIDAARLSDARFLRYAHQHVTHLKQWLEQHVTEYPQARRLVMTDAVFSMDGDIADVSSLAHICQQTNSWLMLDDAHGFGVLGNEGAGVCQLRGLDQTAVPILMATLGKAVGVSGAFIAGSEALIETLIQKARSYIYTTASPPATAAAIVQSIDLIQRESWRRQKLLDLIGYFKQEISSLGVELMPSDTAIQPIVLGDNHLALEASQSLFNEGILVTAIRPPTVPEGSARLRITLSTSHETADIDRLVKALGSIRYMV